MYIYADVIFIINLVMNTVILAVTAWATGVAFRPWRVLAAAALGGCYAIGGLFPDFSLLYSGPAKLAASLILVIAAFGLKRWKVLLGLVAAFYVTSFMMGGAILGWIYFYQEPFCALNFSGIDISWVDVCVGAAVGTVIVAGVIRKLYEGITRRRVLYAVKVRYAGRQAEFAALLDTGNGLYSIGGRKPVMVAALSAIEPLLSDKASNFLRFCPPQEWLASLEECKDPDWLSRIQIIPFRTVSGKGNDLLLGFRPDAVIVSDGLKTAETTNAVIAIYGGNLSTDGSYAALLHPELTGNLKEEAKACVLPGR